MGCRQLGILQKTQHGLKVVHRKSVVDIKGCADAWRWEYYIKDHLGNIRISFADLNVDGEITVALDETNEILEENHYYPFGLKQNGPWLKRKDQGFANKYNYNGKEEMPFTGYLYYGFRNYDPSIARFSSVDPISDQFPWASTFNYAENSPITYIDLHGLQQAIYDINAANNSTFLSAQSVNSQTSGGEKFEKALKSQSKIDVVYAIATRGADGVTAGPFKSFEEFQEGRGESHNLYHATKENWQDYEKYFVEGKEVMVITAMCENNCSDEEVRETTQTINHEEVSHGINRLTGVEKTTSEEHKDL